LLIGLEFKALSHLGIKTVFIEEGFIHLPLENITFFQATQFSIMTLQPKGAMLINTATFQKIWNKKQKEKEYV